MRGGMERGGGIEGRTCSEKNDFKVLLHGCGWKVEDRSLFRFLSLDSRVSLIHSITCFFTRGPLQTHLQEMLQIKLQPRARVLDLKLAQHLGMQDAQHTDLHILPDHRGYRGKNRGESVLEGVQCAFRFGLWSGIGFKVGLRGSGLGGVRDRSVEDRGRSTGEVGRV